MTSNTRWLIPILVVSLAACTLFKKSIERPIVVSCNEKALQVVVYNPASFVKYSLYNSKEQMANTFIEAFKREGSMTANITFSDDPATADFILNLKSLSITESSAIEKIDDPKSNYNGQSMELNTVDCSADIEIINVKHPETKPLYCGNIKSRSEKATNNRDLSDLLSGANKDKTTYRTKLLSDSICIQLCGDVGRRIWTPLTRKLAKELK